MFQSILLNETTKANNSSKFDCAKECPCGVPVIPVPDQWLEVVVTGGFKVWHIIFIIIAFIITMTVVYCCFHRCRIPRTKQEIEADLMKTNLATKFTFHLQELPNEPTTFVEALKKVQEFAEKLEKEDENLTKELGARKRKGWLKLKGKGDKQPDEKENEANEKDDTSKEQTDNVTKEVDGKVEEAKVDDDQQHVNETSPTTVEANGHLQVLNNENVDNIKKVKSEDGIGKHIRSTHRRRHKPGLSRTKATGRIQSSTATTDETLISTFQVIDIDQETTQDKYKKKVSREVPKDDQKEVLQEALKEASSEPIPKGSKHKLRSRDKSEQGHHHVKIDMKAKTLGVNGNHAGRYQSWETPRSVFYSIN